MDPRRHPDDDFQAEIDSHLRLEADRLMAEGMPARDAQAAAHRAFGNITRTRESFYESARSSFWDQLRLDLRYAARTLRKSPAFTLAVALTIALGVGANTAVFSLLDAVLLRSLPVENPKQLFFLRAIGSAGSSSAPQYACFVRLRAETTSFTGMAAFSNQDELRVEIGGRPEEAKGQVATANYFATLGVKPLLGRLLQSGDENLDPPVAVISAGYWQRRFLNDPAVLGKTIVYRNQPFTIVGVTPPDFHGLEPGSRLDLTLPITTERPLMADPLSWGFFAVGRLKPGASPLQAQAEADRVFQSFLSAHRPPQELVRKHFHHLELEPASRGLDALRRRFSKPLFVLLGIVSLVLLMATANITNLLLARGIARSREFAIRLATGAGRFRLVRHLVTETLLLFSLGAIPGLLLALRGVRLVEALFAQGRRPIALDAGLNWRVLAFSFAITLIAGLLAALVPAWRAFRTGPQLAIQQEQGRTTESRRSSRFMRALVAFQVAVSFVLLVAAAALVRSFANLRGQDPGFRNDQVVTMSLVAPDYIEPARSRDYAFNYWTRALESVRDLPGVRSAALAVLTPLSGRDRGAVVHIRGYQPASFEDSTVRTNHVSEDYFETLGISLISGRSFTLRDTQATPRVALINEAAARKFFADRNPIGQTLEFTPHPDHDGRYVVAGVVRDTSHRTLRETVPPFVFLPIRQSGDIERRVTLLVAPTIPDAPAALLQPIRARLAALDTGLLVHEVITIRSQLESTLLTERLMSALSSSFGILALILAAVGLYGVLSYRIGRQQHALGIQMALGASPAKIAAAVLRQSALVVALGLLAGLPFALLAARAAASLLWGVTPSDPAIYAAAACLLCLVAFVAAWLPARRASAIQPSVALRHN